MGNNNNKLYNIVIKKKKNVYIMSFCTLKLFFFVTCIDIKLAIHLNRELSQKK